MQKYIYAISGNMKKTILTCAFSFCLSILVIGQNLDTTSTLISIHPSRLAELDEYARSTPNKSEADIQTLADYLMKAAQNDAEKVRLIFTWVAFHVNYDAKAINTGDYGDMSAEGVLKSRKGICEGFSNLFFELCDAAGVEVVTISGYAKGYGYRPRQKFYEPDHAWNAVNVDGSWHFIDVTWGQGYGETKQGKLIARKQFDDYWFDAHPKEFIFTHLPEDPYWQLLADPISKTQFEQMPYINPLLFYYGFDKDSIFTRIMEKKNTRFVTLYDVDVPVEILAAPLSRDIKKGEHFTCIIRSEGAYEIAAIVNNKWTSFNKEGSNQFELTFKPEPGELYIVVKLRKKDKEYQRILSYRIVRWP